MSEPVERAADWMYRGVWKVVTDGFRVPENPPVLPVAPGERVISFHPSSNFLSYMKAYFWVGLAAIDLLILVAWIVLFVFQPRVAMWLALPALLVAVVPDIVAYVALHLKYDTMWYVMSERSLRCRRGIWIILEHTITFENVQNVHVRQGPIQQLFGISTIVVETAGASEGEANVHAVGNKAVMEGISNPAEIRRQIMDRVRASRGAGLGEEEAATTAGWSARHLDVLKEIREELRLDQ